MTDSSSSLREQLRAMVEVLLSPRLDPADLPEEDRVRLEALSDEDRFQTDLNVAIRFIGTEVIGGYITRLGEKGFEIRISDSFIDSIYALVASLLIHVDGLSDYIIDTNEKGVSASLEHCRGLVDKDLKEVGIEEYWNILGRSKPENIYESYLQALLSSHPLHAIVAKMAAFAACAFISLHEGAHAFGGHLAYRFNTINSCDTFDDERLASELKQDLGLFELIADSSALAPLFGLMASHEGEFANSVRLHDGNNGFAALYCCGYSAGFGVATVFLLTDSLFLASPEDYHPPSLERLTLILGTVVSKCARLHVFEKGEHFISETIGLTYDYGFFAGARKCLKTWDASR